jgi:predicted lipid-binding transport protein (Tim44 family)
MLTGTTEEVGTSLPTVVAPDAPAKFEELRARDPEFSWSAFTKRVELVFSTFHAAWSSQELAPVRPFLSDALFETQQYWVATYKAQGLRNVTEEPRIVGIYCARVASDKYFDAVTVRVFASAIDYTVDAKGTVVGGNKSKVREYSEYWTFIRAAGNAGAPRSEPGCPNCGAPTSDINMAGRCSTCGVKMTMGEFDWVLSRIQQDEVYA